MYSSSDVIAQFSSIFGDVGTMFVFSIGVIVAGGTALLGLGFGFRKIVWLLEDGFVDRWDTWEQDAQGGGTRESHWWYKSGKKVHHFVRRYTIVRKWRAMGETGI